MPDGYNRFFGEPASLPATATALCSTHDAVGTCQERSEKSAAAREEGREQRAERREMGSVGEARCGCRDPRMGATCDEGREGIETSQDHDGKEKRGERRDKRGDRGLARPRRQGEERRGVDDLMRGSKWQVRRTI